MAALLPIFDEDDFATAILLLRKGFPERPEAFWRRGWNRARDHLPSTGHPVGFILKVKDRAAGVMLTFASSREDCAGLVVNLSSWYVEEEARFAAPLMLKQLTQSGDTFTDLTPVPAVVRVSTALGFRIAAEHAALIPLPLHLLSSGRHVEAVAFGPCSHVPAMPEPLLKMVADHQALGCDVFLLSAGESWSPLILQRRRSRGIPYADVIYGDRQALIQCLPVLARQLLARGIALLSLDLETTALAPRRAIRMSRNPRLVKGKVQPNRIDYAYSELVLFALTHV
jgi:hypothetical protein